MAPVQTLIAGLLALVAQFPALSPSPPLSLPVSGAAPSSVPLALPSPIQAPVDVGNASSRGPDYGSYSWPVRGPVLRGFEAPATSYASGHRGIDIGAPFASPVVASNDGRVAFAGWVAGSLFVSIDHADGVRTTYSWLSEVGVVQGEAVVRGATIGKSGHGHPEEGTPHLHFGARVGETYIDPMLLLDVGSVAGLIHLAPLASAT